MHFSANFQVEKGIEIIHIYGTIILRHIAVADCSVIGSSQQLPAVIVEGIQTAVTARIKTRNVQASPLTASQAKFQQTMPQGYRRGLVVPRRPLKVARQNGTQ